MRVAAATRSELTEHDSRRLARSLRPRTPTRAGQHIGYLGSEPAEVTGKLSELEGDALFAVGAPAERIGKAARCCTTCAPNRTPVNG